MSELKARLAHLQSEQKRIEEDIRATYARSIRAEGTEKLCSDQMAEMLAEPSPFKKIQYPLEIAAIAYDDVPVFCRSEKTTWVAVLSCKPEHGDKTRLGVLLGTMALSLGCSLSKDGVLQVGRQMHNPAIYVPDLNDIVFGAGSWWQKIETPEALRQISSEDIDGVWYVRALKDLDRGAA